MYIYNFIIYSDLHDKNLTLINLINLITLIKIKFLIYETF